MRFCRAFHRFFMFPRNNHSAMRRTNGTSPCAARLLLGAGIAAAMAFCLPVRAATNSNPSLSYAGAYRVLVNGYWHTPVSNTGFSCTVTQGSASLNVPVADDSGTIGRLIGQVTIDATGHMSGSGTVMGISVLIEGRVDARDPPPPPTQNREKRSPKDPVVTDARFQAVFVGGGHSGRIVGARIQ